MEGKGYAILVFYTVFLMSICVSVKAQGCTDVLPNCNMYMDFSCKAPYINWALKFCKRRCNLCNYVPPGTGTSCQDVKPNCADFMYNDKTFCTGQFTVFARNNCPRSCNFCSQDPNQMVRDPPVGMASTKLEVVDVAFQAKTCEDNLDKCDSYPDSACEMADWSVANCKKRCKLCADTPETCEDKVSDCHPIQCGGYLKDWARQFCPVTCNFCNATARPAIILPTSTVVPTARPAITLPTRTVSPTTAAPKTSVPPPTRKTIVSNSKTTATSVTKEIVAVTLVPKSNWDMKTRFPRRTLLPPMCDDLRGDCKSFPDSKCLDYMWAIPNCKKRCNICGATSQVCEDKTDCSRFGSSLRCDGYFRYWARQYCPVKCGYCTKSKTPALLKKRNFSSDINCYHNGKTYQPGESYVTDCKWRWTCGEATGKGICWNWDFTNFPNCYMKPPKPGKCCSTAFCTDGTRLMYPAGYKEE